MSTPTPTTSPKYAAIYARVASADQATGSSLPTQIAACQALVTQDGFVVPSAYICVEEGMSGTTLDRPALRQVRELVRRRAIAALYVYDHARLSRHLDHHRLLADEFARHQVALRLVVGRHDQGPDVMQYLTPWRTMPDDMDV